MKRVLVHYGYFSAWDCQNDWGKNLYRKKFLLESFKEYIDEIIIIKNIKELKNYLNNHGKNFKNYILPTKEIHVKELFCEKIKSLFSIDKDAVYFEKLLDKKSFSNYLKEINLLHYSPEIYSKSSNRSIDKLVIIKPKFYAGSIGIYKKNLRDVKDWEFDNNVVQEYIYGSHEYDAVFVFNKGVVTLAFAYMCGFEKKEHIKSQTDSKIVSYKRVNLDNNIIKSIEEVLRPFSFTGTCCFDFKIQNGNLRIFEINPRLDGALCSSHNKSDLFKVIRELIKNDDENNKLS